MFCAFGQHLGLLESWQEITSVSGFSSLLPWVTMDYGSWLPGLLKIWRWIHGHFYCSIVIWVCWGGGVSPCWAAQQRSITLKAKSVCCPWNIRVCVLLYKDVHLSLTSPTLSLWDLTWFVHHLGLHTSTNWQAHSWVDHSYRRDLSPSVLHRSETCTHQQNCILNMLKWACRYRGTQRHTTSHTPMQTSLSVLFLKGRLGSFKVTH